MDIYVSPHYFGLTWIGDVNVDEDETCCGDVRLAVFKDSNGFLAYDKGFGGLCSRKPTNGATNADLVRLTGPGHFDQLVEANTNDAERARFMFEIDELRTELFG